MMVNINMANIGNIILRLKENDEYLEPQGHPEIGSVDPKTHDSTRIINNE